MKRKRNLILRQRGMKVAFLLVALALLAAFYAPAAQAGPNPQQRFLARYTLASVPTGNFELCPGEKKTISIYVERQISNFPITYVGQGVSVIGIANDSTIVELSPTHPSNPDLARSITSNVGGGIGASAEFDIQGILPGSTLLTFKTEIGATDPDLKIPISTPSGHIRVEVKRCYEAYASGLTTMNVGNEWSDADICDLEKSFTLAATGKQKLSEVSANTGSVDLKFTPSSDPSHGTYTSKVKLVIQAPSGTQECWNIGNGGYDVTWYNPEKSQGDIHLHGTYSSCGNPAPSNFDLRVGFEVLTFDSASLYTCQRP